MSKRYDKITDCVRSDLGYKLSLQYLPHALSLMSSPPVSIQADEGVSVPEVFQGQTLLNEHTTDGVICPTCTGKVLMSMVGVGGSFTRDLQMIKKAVAICSLALGTNHIIVSSYRSLEADALRLLMDHTSAEMTYREALVGYESTLGSANRETLDIERKIAFAMSMQGKYDEAERLLVRLRKTSCEEHGQEDPVTVKITQALSNNMVAQGRNEEALKLNLEISKLDIDRRSKWNLASSYRNMSEYTEAETLYLSLLDDEDALRRERCVDFRDPLTLLRLAIELSLASWAFETSIDASRDLGWSTHAY